MNSNLEGAPRTAEEAEHVLRQLAEQSQQVDVDNHLTFDQLTPPDFVTATDIDDLSAVEDLQLARVRYRVLVEQIPAITFMASLSGDQNELYVSPYIEIMLGFTQEEWLSDPFLWYRQLHPDDRVKWHNEFAKTCATGVHFKSEYRFLSRDGQVVWVHGEARVIRDAAGAPIFMHGIAFDITESKRAQQVLAEAQTHLERRVDERTAELTASQQELRRSTQMLAAVVDNAVDAIITIDAECEIRSVNNAAEKIFGYTAQEMIGQNVNILMPDPYRTDHDRYVQNYLHTGNRKIIGIGREVVGLRKDGTTFPMELAVSEVRSGDQVLFTGIVRDITERKQAEREIATARVAAEDANRAKSEFLANMSHEIRTPMNGIIGMSELALDTKLNSEQRDYVDTIRDSANALLDIINDILDFSKIEAGKMEIENVSFKLRESIGKTFKPLAVRAHRKNIELAWRVANDVPEKLVGDVTRIRQVVLNLVGNAVKFTDQGEVVLDVSLESEEDDVVMLQFSVRDSGIGIASDKLQSVFAAFSQADASVTRTHGGTGLGLSISAKLVQMMEGRIWVESNVGEGSTFRFVLPLQRDDEDEAEPEVRVELRGLEVLIVDDNATNRRILEELLKRWEMIPTSASDGEAGLELLKKAHATGRPFQMVITDCHMPEMDGFTFVERIRTDEYLPPAVIMMLTSAAQPGSFERCQQLSIAAHLLKPVGPSELLEALQQAMGASDVSNEPASVPADRVLSPGLRILLVEDNPVNQKLAVRLLSKWGHQVEMASNGEEAISRWQKGTFDVILMDVQMPVMDGFAATAKIRQLEESSGTHVPIIAMTAHAMTGDRERCLEAGMDAYISKPIVTQDLRRLLNEYQPDSKRRAADVLYDRDIALHYCDGDEKVLEEIVGLLKRDAPKVLRDMQQAIREADLGQVSEIVDALIGTLTCFGAMPAQNAAQQVADHALRGELKSARLAYPELERNLHELLDQVDAILTDDDGAATNSSISR